MITAIVATLVAGSSECIDRHLLTKKGLEYKKFVALSFLAMFYFMIPIAHLFFGWNPQMFSIKYLLYLGAMVLAAIAYAALYYRGLKHTPVETVAPLFMSSWVFTVVLALVLFPAERDWLNVVLALVAFGAIMYPNVQNLEIKLTKHQWAIIGAAFLWALHTIFLNKLLVVYNPLMLTFVRAGLVAMILVPMYKVEKKDLDGRISWLSLRAIGNIAWWALALWSYQAIGIIMTSIILGLYPLVSQWFAWFFLGEKVQRKNVIAVLVVIGCIVLSFIL